MPNIELTITLTDQGAIGLSGPLDNGILFYGMLEAAKDAFHAHQEQAKKMVQLATGPLQGPSIFKP